MSELQNKTAFEIIGGTKTVTELVNRFYFLMDTLPEASEIRAQHQPDLSEANEKLRLFLTGWLGGPPLYMDKYGHPRLRARHLPFKIGWLERDQWLLCMFKAIEEVQIEPSEIRYLQSALSRLADHMRNQNEDESGTP